MVIDRPPACKIAEVRTGNYSLIWSGLSANLHNARKYLFGFELSALYCAMKEGLVCRPVEIWAPFEATAGFNISTPHPLA